MSHEQPGPDVVGPECLEAPHMVESYPIHGIRIGGKTYGKPVESFIDEMVVGVGRGQRGMMCCSNEQIALQYATLCNQRPGILARAERSVSLGWVVMIGPRS